MCRIHNRLTANYSHTHTMKQPLYLSQDEWWTLHYFLDEFAPQFGEGQTLLDVTKKVHTTALKTINESP